MNSNIFNKTHYNIAKLSTVCADGHTIIWVINSMTEQRVFEETVASLLQTLSANPNKLSTAWLRAPWDPCAQHSAVIAAARGSCWRGRLPSCGTGRP